jgi:hypothetical protein
VGYVVDKVALRCFTKYFNFLVSITPPVVHTHSFIHSQLTV